MDAVAAAIRIGRPYSPRLAAEAYWLRHRANDPVRQAVDRLVPRGATALDIGASRGGFTGRLLRLVGRGGFVHAFEANPMHAGALRRMGRGANLRVHSLALSDRRGTATLHLPVVDGEPLPGMASLEAPGARQHVPTEELSVPTASLAEVLGELDRLDFVKCDVEGHEDAVMAGGRDLLAAHRPTVVIEIEQRHRSRDVSEAFRHFEQLGYDGWAFFADGLRPLGEFDVERDQLGIVRADPLRQLMPEAYVHNFLFAAPGIDLSALLEPAAT